jgi:hypothetical protein
VKPRLVKQARGPLQLARRAKKRRQHEIYEDDGNAATIGLSTKLRPITHANQIGPTVQHMLEDLRQGHISKMQNGFGFMIRAIVNTFLKVAEYIPLAGTSYLPLPSFLLKKPIEQLRAFKTKTCDALAMRCLRRSRTSQLISVHKM